ncbi:MAG: glycoside hydrolase family 28 protein [Rhodopirellula sp.]|nr:glycoside hydrolase family 28 protein [Rhodopirellula sp.]
MATKLLTSAALAVVLLCRPGMSAVFNIRDYGARGDRQTNDAQAIQSAVDACHTAGGGTVYFPPGDYLSGMIRLKSRVTLRLENGATLWASPNESDYVRSSHVGRGVKVIYYLLVAEDQENIVLEGDGTIHGVGRSDLLRRPGTNDTMPPFQIGTVFLQRCRNVSVRNLKFRYSALWTLHFYRCEEVFVEGVSIVNNYFRTVTDGIDPVSSHNVHITNCHISTGDDCICLKTREGFPCRDVVVSNCTLESIATAVKIGTESEGDFSDIRVDNCTIRNSTVGVGIYIKDGGTAERLAFSNLSIGTVEEPSQLREYSRNAIFPIFVDVEKREPGSAVGVVRDLVFRDIQIHSDNGILLQGMPESPLENVTLENISMRVVKGFDYSNRVKHGGGAANPDDDRRTRFSQEQSYGTLAFAKGLFIDGFRLFIADKVFEEYPRSALCIHEVESGVLRGVRRSPADVKRSPPVVRLQNCRGLCVIDFGVVSGQ